MECKLTIPKFPVRKLATKMEAIQNRKDDISEDDEAETYAIYLRSVGTFPAVLNSSLQLGLFNIIARAGPGIHISPAEIVSQLPAKNPDATSMIDRMLRLLASYSLVTCSTKTLEDGRIERVYGLAPAGKVLVSDKNGGSNAGSFGPEKAFSECWFYLKDLVLEGGNLFERVHGKSVYEYMSANPVSSRNFDDMMDKLSQKTMKKVLEKYKGFENLTSLVDVGGGSGVVMEMIIAKYPTIKGINYDLPHVLQNAPPYPGFKHVEGDMFQTIPNGDAILLKGILHNWSEESCLKILKNCRDALPKDGKIIVVSYMIPEVPDSSTAAKLACHMDVMMFLFPGGRQRTLKEFEALCKDGGFSEFKFCGYVHGIEVVMEFYK